MSRVDDQRASDLDDELEQEFIEFCNGLPCIYLFAISIVLGVVLVGVMSSSITLAFVVVLCLIPTALVFYFAYIKNHLDSVSPNAVIHTFCWGAVGALPVLSVQIMSVACFTGAWDLLGEPTEEQLEDQRDSPPSVGRGIIFSVYQAFLVCSVSEECLKYFLVTQFPGSSFANRPYGVVVLCIAGAMGFATMENLGYVLLDDSGVSYMVALMRGFVDILLHASLAALIGVRVGLKDHLTQPFLKMMALPFLIHGFYDLFLMIPSRLGSTFPLLHFLPLASVVITMASVGHSLQQIQGVSEYDLISSRDQHAVDSATDPDAPINDIRNL